MDQEIKEHPENSRDLVEKAISIGTGIAGHRRPNPNHQVCEAVRALSVRQRRPRALVLLQKAEQIQQTGLVLRNGFGGIG